MQCTQAQHFQLVYFCRFATFSKARHAVIYSVGSLDVLQTNKACRSLRSWASKNGSENMQFLYKYDKMSLFGQICQHKASCTPGFVEQRTCITRWRGGLGGAQPAPVCKTWTRIRTHISSCTPLMDLYCNVVCDVAMCLLYKIAVLCSMLTLPRAANIGICSFPGFSQGQNAVIDSIRSISKTARNFVICISPSFSKVTCCFLPASRSVRNLPRAATKDQRTRGPEDQGTTGPGDQRTRASPNSRAQAEPTLGKKHGTLSLILTKKNRVLVPMVS